MIEDSVIEVHDLRKDYGTVTAVAGISFEVARGEVFALIGTNGAGKTTTMDVLTGFQAPTGGSVSVLGANPLTERARIAPQMGIMLQEAGFFDGLSVGETIDAWRRFTPGARPRAEALKIAGLERNARTPVGRLSGGEKRRLDLALSLLGRPDVLFLDEPTTGLDPEARRNTWEFVRELNLSGMTVLLTTHYMEEAEFLAMLDVVNDGVSTGSTAPPGRRGHGLQGLTERLAALGGELAGELLPGGGYRLRASAPTGTRAAAEEHTDVIPRRDRGKPAGTRKWEDTR